METRKIKFIRLRYPAVCTICKQPLAAGTQASWDRVSGTATCQACRSNEERDLVAAPPTDHGHPGASAAREYAKRRNAREKRVRRAHPVLGEFLLAISREPQSTTAWQQGAEGERRLGVRLDDLLADGMAVAHDRKVPGTQANIDHIVVARSGIHVIDAKNYSGLIETRDKGGIFSSDVRLYVGGRDRSKLVKGMTRQLLAVDKAAGDLALHPPTVITPVLCFIDANTKWFAKPFRIDGVLVTWPNQLIKYLARPGPLTPEQVGALGTQLLNRLPPA